jgi:hypothetical protein
MLDPGQAARYRARWDEVQTIFVDRPLEAVGQADGLVGDVLGDLERTFREQRARLDPSTGGDEEASTEDLRRALQRYREFFDRLLAL